jgi:hypothetical protein
MIWRWFDLRQALYLAFCGTFIVIARAVLRLHLQITGHSMLFNLFFLMLARGAVRKFGAATLAGLLAGLLCVVLGLGKGGVIQILRFGLLGLVVDLAATLSPKLFRSYLACCLVGALAASTRGLWLGMADLMAGMEVSLMLQHVLISSGMNMLFGAVGGLLVPPVVKRLETNGLVC